MPATFADALAQVVTALERLGVAYFVAGSVASVVYGELRTTQDVDIVVRLHPAQVPALAGFLEPDFFVDAAFLAETAHHGGSCNVIHRISGFKVDFFQLRPRPFSRTEMERRRPVELRPGLAPNFASAEDCVLTKLEWFEKGDRVSDRPWRDALGILKGQREHLDLDYMRRWASELGIGELLVAALGEAGFGC